MSARVARVVTARPRWMLLGTVAVTIVLGLGIRSPALRPLLEGDLPTDDVVVRDDATFRARHPDRNFYAIGVEVSPGETIWNPGTLAKIADISRAAASVPGASANVVSLATWQNVMASDGAIEIVPLMPGAAWRPDDIASVRNRVASDPLLNGRLVSRDGRMALVRLTIADDAEPGSLHAALHDLRRRFEGPEHVAVFGRHHLNREIDLAVERNVVVLGPLAAVLLLSFLYWFFRSWHAVWVSASLVVLANVWFLGLVGYFEIPGSVLTSMIPVLVVVIVGSYIVHLLWAVWEAASGRSWPDAVRLGVEHTVVPIGVATLSSVVGFGSLIVFQIVSIREFGVLTALAIAIAAVLTTVWAPTALLMGSPPTVRRLDRGAGRAIALSRCLVAVCIRAGRARSAWWMFAAACALSVVGVSRLRVGSDPAEFFPHGHVIRRAFEALLARFDGDGYLFVEVEAPEGEDAYSPTFLQRVADLQNDIEGVEGVAYATSVVDVVKRMHEQIDLQTAPQQALPETRAAVAQYLELYRWRAPAAFDEMTENDDPPRRIVVDVFGNVNSSAEIERILEKVRRAVAVRFPTSAEGLGVLGGEYVLWTAQNRYIVVGKLWNVGAAIVTVGVVCWMVLRNARAATLALLPPVFSALLVFGGMGFVGIPLDLASCVITATVIGMGVDFEVQLFLRFEELARLRSGSDSHDYAVAEAMAYAGPPLLVNTGANVLAFGVWMLSPLEPLRHVGLLVCLSMIACAVATLVLVPPLLPFLPKGARR